MIGLTFLGIFIMGKVLVSLGKRMEWIVEDE
jgi:hypothetical protein